VEGPKSFELQWQKPTATGEPYTCQVSAYRVPISLSSRLEHWPSQFVLHICKRPAVLQAMHVWVETNNPPLCAFMPDRHPNPQHHKLNQSNFRSFARLLAENQLVSFGLCHHCGQKMNSVRRSQLQPGSQMSSLAPASSYILPLLRRASS
jgi:hypothetical protein